MLVKMIVMIVFVCSMINDCEGIRIKPVPHYYFSKNTKRTEDICNNQAYSNMNNKELFECFKGYEPVKCINLNDFEAYNKIYSNCVEYNFNGVYRLVLMVLVIFVISLISLVREFIKI
jgi:hypothetical protein